MIAVLFVAGQGLHRDRRQFARDGPLRGALNRRRNAARDHIIKDGAQLAAAHRRGQGQQLIEDRPQRIHIAAFVHRCDVATGLLGRHVGRRALDRHPAGFDLAVVAAEAFDDGGQTFIRSLADLGRRDGKLRGRQLGRDRWSGLGEAPGPLDPAPNPRQAPVHDQHFAEVADHDVARLEVAVDNPAIMGEGRRIEHRQVDVQEIAKTLHRLIGFLATGRLDRRLNFAAPQAAKDLGEAAAAHQLHGNEQPPVRIDAEIVDRDDIGMFELAGDLGFFDETFALTLAVVLEQDLHRHIAPNVAVDRAQDHAHAAAGDLAGDHIFFTARPLSQDLVDGACRLTRLLVAVGRGRARCGMLQGDAALEPDLDKTGGRAAHRGRRNLLGRLVVVRQIRGTGRAADRNRGRAGRLRPVRPGLTGQLASAMSATTALEVGRAEISSAVRADVVHGCDGRSDPDGGRAGWRGEVRGSGSPEVRRSKTVPTC